MRKILITGGAGYIGSTVASACADAGMQPIILDDLSTGLRAFAERYSFYEGDYGDVELVRRILDEHPDLHAVVHCAASIVVPESMSYPLEYYENNVSKVPGFLAELLRGHCHRVLFSSTAAMYDPGDGLVVTEESPVTPGSPYAASKVMVERILADTARASDLRAISLRYFNPIGADPAGRTGIQVERPTHVLGKMMEALASNTPFTVTGTSWPTRDGSGLRDYVHVWDLALAHVAAIRNFDHVFHGETASPGYEIVNLGTGLGTTVFELAQAFQTVTGKSLILTTAAIRPGDVVGACASGTKALRLLGWRAERSLADGIADALAWSQQLPAFLPSLTTFADE